MLSRFDATRAHTTPWNSTKKKIKNAWNSSNLEFIYHFVASQSNLAVFCQKNKFFLSIINLLVFWFKSWETITIINGMLMRFAY